VVVESWQVQTPPGDPSLRELLHTIDVETDAQGRWSVPEERDWKLAILAADGFPYFRQSACVIVSGHVVFAVNPFSGAEEGYRRPVNGLLPEVLALESSTIVSPSMQTPSSPLSRCGVSLEPRLSKQ
jgi:hypothetical protein